jgi:hypothetical protein
LALRLPSLLGFLLASLCLAGFVARRLPASYGLVAAVFPAATWFYYYAHEARPYAMMLGFAALTLYCWQWATSGNRPTVPFIGLAVGATGAVASHYYGVLVLFPIALGEMVRTVEIRRVDIRVWSALAFAVLPLLVILPLIEASRQSGESFWAPPRVRTMIDLYKNLLRPAVAVLLVALLYMGLHRWQSVRIGQPHLARTMIFPMPLHEVVAAVGFALLPAIGLVLAILVTGAFTDRYFIPAVLGLAILLALTTFYVSAGRSSVAMLIAVLLLVELVRIQSAELRKAEDGWQALSNTVTLLRSVGSEDLPIVASELHTFLELSHHAPPDIASRLVYLADPAQARRLLGFASVDQGAIDLVGPWFHTNVEPFKTFILSNRRFFVYGGKQGNMLNWIHRELEERGYLFEPKGTIGAKALFIASAR